MLFNVEALIDGGKVATGTVESPTDDRDYILHRFLARKMPGNRGKQDFWYYRNATRAKITPAKAEPLRRATQDELGLPDPKVDMPDWPASVRPRRAGDV